MLTNFKTFFSKSSIAIITYNFFFAFLHKKVKFRNFDKANNMVLIKKYLTKKITVAS